MEKKTSNVQLKNLLIGIFIVIAIAIIVWFLLFFRPQEGDRGQKLQVRFSSIADVNIGTPVTFAGKMVGKVEKINQIFEARQLPTDSLGRPYFYELILVVDSSVRVYTTDLIEVQTSGLLGEKVIAIIPKTIKDDQKAHLIKDQIIYAQSFDPFTSTLVSVEEASQEMAQTMKIFNRILKNNENNINSIISSVNDSMNEIEVILKDINKLDLIKAFNTAALNASALLKNVDNYVEEIRDSKLLNNIASATANLDTVTENLAQGKGTLGKLINDPTIYLQTVAVMDKFNILLNDVNHYGAFFHLNKGWQRTRLKRINEMQALKTPTNFKDYFEKEFDQVSTSLSRISSLIDKADETNKELYDNKAFKDAFLQLMKEVNELNSIIELYNQKLLESKK